MKKFKVMLLMLASTLSLSACNSLGDKAFDDKSELQGRFVTVDIVQNIYDGGIYIIKDKETGVNYIYIRASYISAFSPLYDSNGKIVVDKED